MTWSNGAFTSSPLSRSALRGEADSNSGPPFTAQLGSSGMLGLAQSPSITSKLDQRRIVSQPHPPPSQWTASTQVTTAASPPPQQQQQSLRRTSGPTHHAHSPYATSPLSSARYSSSPPRWNSTGASPSSPLSPRCSKLSYNSPSSFTSRRRTSAPIGSVGSWGGAASSSLVGSYEESLLSGRMSSTPSRALVFDAEIGVLGLGKCKPSLKCPPHLNVSFAACFYSLEQGTGEATMNAGLGSPYVGTIDLETHYLNVLAQRTAGAMTDQGDTTLSLVPETEEEAHRGSGLGLVSSGGGSVSPSAWATRRASAHALSSSPGMRNGQVPRPLRPAPPSSNNSSASSSIVEALPLFPGYRVPAKGQVQLVIKNPNCTAVKLFLVPYDLSDMRPGTKTFIRQKCHVVPTPPLTLAPAAPPPSPPRSATTSTQTHAQTRPTKETLRYAIHLQFCAPPLPVQQTKRAPRQRPGAAAEPGFGGRDRLPPQHDLEQLERQVDDEDDSSRPTSTSQPAKTTTTTPSASPVPRIYLHKTIRVVFAARLPDKSERLSTVTEMPGLAAPPGLAAGVVAAAAAKAATAKREGVYTAYAGPGEEWRECRALAKEAIAAAASRNHNRSKGAETLGQNLVDESGARDIPAATSSRSADGISTSNLTPASAMPHNASPSMRSSSSNSIPTLSSPQGAVSFPAANLDNGEQHKPRERRLRQGSVASSGGASSGIVSRASSRRASSATTSDGSLSAHTMADRLAAARATSPSPTHGAVERSLSPTVSDADSTASTGAHEDRALLDAWHQTMRRPPSYNHMRPISPAPGVALPLSFVGAANASGSSSTGANGTTRPASPTMGGMTRPLSPPNVRRAQATPLSPTKLRSLSEVDDARAAFFRSASPVASLHQQRGIVAPLPLTSMAAPAPARQTRPPSPASSYTAELCTAASSGTEAVRGLMTSLEELRLARPSLSGRRLSSHSSITTVSNAGGSGSNNSSPSSSGFLPPRMERVNSGGGIAASVVSFTSIASGETAEEPSSTRTRDASAVAAATSIKRSRAASLLEIARRHA